MGWEEWNLEWELEENYSDVKIASFQPRVNKISHAYGGLEAHLHGHSIFHFQYAIQEAIWGGQQFVITLVLGGTVEMAQS